MGTGGSALETGSLSEMERYVPFQFPFNIFHRSALIDFLRETSRLAKF